MDISQLVTLATSIAGPLLFEGAKKIAGTASEDAYEFVKEHIFRSDPVELAKAEQAAAVTGPAAAKLKLEQQLLEMLVANENLQTHLEVAIQKAIKENLVTKGADGNWMVTVGANSKVVNANYISNLKM